MTNPTETLKTLADWASPALAILSAVTGTVFVCGGGHDVTWAFMSLEGLLAAIWVKLL